MSDTRGMIEPLVIRKEVEVDAPPETVWYFVATADGLKTWFQAERIVLEPRPGGRYEEHANYPTGPHHVVGEVLVYDPPRRFVHGYRVQDEDGGGWEVDTTVSITLTPIGSRTRVTLEHSGFERLPVDSAHRTFKAWNGGWEAAADRLPDVVARGATGELPALTIRKDIEIDAPIERVWPFIGTAEGYARWSCPPAEAHDVVLEPRVGGRFEDRMVVGGREYHSVGEIVVYDPPHRIAVRERSMAGDLVGAQHTSTFTITLTDLAGRTRVSVEHSGFESLPMARRAEAFESFDQGWAHAVVELRVAVGLEAAPGVGVSATMRRLLIHREIEIDAPASRVWWYIATAEGRKEHLRCRYPATQFEVEHFEPREGSRWESAGISAHTGDRYRQSGHIVRYDPPNLLMMTFREDGWPAETLVTYRLSESSGRTRLTLVHSGFEKLPPQRRMLTWKAYEIGRFKSLEPIRDLAEGREPAVGYPQMIRKEIEIAAPIERVWWYIGTQDGSLARHRAENVPGRIDYEAETLEPRPGGRYELRGTYEGAPFVISGQVLAYDPPTILALSWKEEGWPVDTLVRFRLAEQDGRTRVTVIHNGFEHLPPEVRQRELPAYEAGRERSLQVLRAMAERAHPL